MYTYSQFKSAVNSRIANKIDILADPMGALNDVVAEVITDHDLKSQKRSSVTVPNLFTEVYNYALATDFDKLIDIMPQVKRNKSLEWRLTTPEEFDRQKYQSKDLCAIQISDNVTKLLASTLVDDTTSVPSTLDTLTSGLASGSWTAFGDAENLVADQDNYVKGNGSIKFGINASGSTTAGIQSATVSTYDITDYLADGSGFVWVYMPSVTNITNVKLRLGNDSSNYYEFTATTTNENTNFVVGWNLIRFTLSSGVQTGTVDTDTCEYAVIYLTKDSSVINLTSFRFDHIFLKIGKIYSTIYYSNYPWQSSTGTYKLRATTTSDVLNATSREYQLFIEKAVAILGNVVKEFKLAEIAQGRYDKQLLPNYKLDEPSEALVLQTTSYVFGSSEYSDDARFLSR